ncbi:unnamed protein product, partial [Schistosoma haematobium]
MPVNRRRRSSSKFVDVNEESPIVKCIRRDVYQHQRHQKFLILFAIIRLPVKHHIHHQLVFQVYRNNDQLIHQDLT